MSSSRCGATRDGSIVMPAAPRCAFAGRGHHGERCRYPLRSARRTAAASMSDLHMPRRCASMSTHRWRSTSSLIRFDWVAGRWLLRYPGRRFDRPTTLASRCTMARKLGSASRPTRHATYRLPCRRRRVTSAAHIGQGDSRFGVWSAQDELLRHPDGVAHRPHG